MMTPPASETPMSLESGSQPSAAASSSSSSGQNEAFVLLANGTKGAAAVGLIRQVLESPAVFVFGELLDHPNIQALSTAPPADGPAYFRLLEIFAYGTYDQYLEELQSHSLPDLTEQMKKKLRLLTMASMANSTRVLEYSKLQRELRIDSVRELEDLLIEGASANVATGKLDQKSLHFEVDYVMARDIRKCEVKGVISTLEEWCNTCDGMLSCLEDQATRANSAKTAALEHKRDIDQRIQNIRGQVKQSHDGSEDPDSRMDTDRGSGGGADQSRRDMKKATKSKGQRAGQDRNKGGGASGSGGNAGVAFWQK